MAAPIRYRRAMLSLLSSMNESAQHAQTKRLIAKMAAANGRRFIVAAETLHGYRSYSLDLSAAATVVECSDDGHPCADPHAYKYAHKRFPSLIYDVGFVQSGRVVAAIEVVKTHGLDARKVAKITAAGVLCVAVKANAHEWHVDDRRLEAIAIIEQLGSAVRLRRLAPP